ncbi:minor tail protein [Gordonia phage LittleFella]|nr:minor tail protein [Gordonia phage LittleFella]
MADSNSREVFFLKQIAQQKYNKDFAVNMVQVNNTLTSLSKYLIVMQQGIDDLNRDIVEQIRDFIQELIIIFNGGNFSELGLDWGHLKYVFQAIGAFFGFPTWNGGTAWSPMQMVSNFFSNFLSGLSGFGNFIHNAFDSAIDFILGLLSWIPGVGSVREKFAGAINKASETADIALESADSAQAQIVTIQQVFSVRSNRPFWEGPDPTGESSFPFCMMAKPTAHNHGFSADGSGSRTTNITGVSRISATQSLVPMAFVKCESNTEKAQASFKCRKVGTINAVYVDFYKMTEDGSLQLITSTGDVKDDILTTMAWQQVAMPTPYLSEMGDWIGVQWRVIGSGSLELAGVEMEAENFFPTFRPLNYGLMRTANNAPSTIARADVDVSYTPLVAYVQIGSDVGQIDAPRNFFDNFNRGSLGSSWLLQRWSALNGIGGGVDLSIVDGVLRSTNSQLVEQRAAALWTLPLASDQIGLEWQSVGNAYGDRFSGGILCSTSGFNNTIYVANDNDRVGIFTLPSLGGAPTNRAFASTPSNDNVGAVNWRATFDGPVAQGGTNTYRVYRNGAFITSWTDSTGVITHGKGNRFCGALITHGSFSSGNRIDNWRAYDLAGLAA